MKYINLEQVLTRLAFLFDRVFLLFVTLLKKNILKEVIKLGEWVGAKELYDIKLRLNTPLKLGDRQYDINETILCFEKGEMIQLQAGVMRHGATGGFNNNLLISWDTDKEMVFKITHGILSPTSWALLTNSKIKKGKKKSISYDEVISTVEKDNQWHGFLKYVPNHIEKYGIQGNPNNEQLPMGRKEWIPLKPLPPARDRFIFCYDMKTGLRIKNFDLVGNVIIFYAEHEQVIVDYTFDYEDEYITLDIGNRLLNGFLNLSAKMTVKDYITGEPRTAVIDIPKIKLNSNLIASLGNAYDCSTVSDFIFIGYPQEGRQDGQTSICQITFLPTELEGEYL